MVLLLVWDGDGDVLSNIWEIVQPAWKCRTVCGSDSAHRLSDSAYGVSF